MDKGAPATPSGRREPDPQAVPALRASVPSAFDLMQQFYLSRYYEPGVRPADNVQAAIEFVLDRYCSPNRLTDMELALGYALEVLGQWEPGDSRAVSNEFVAMYSILCDLTNDECRTILAQAIEARRATTGTGVVHESAVAEGHAPETPIKDPNHDQR